MIITEFLLARIAEDEAAARVATTRAGSTIYTDARRGGKQAVLEHIARHTPARVLRECKAKRRIVELHHAGREHEDHPACVLCQWDVDCDAPRHDHQYATGLRVEWPCETLEALASVYADHPDYRDEWRI